MLNYQIHWTGIVNCNGHIEIHSGIKITHNKTQAEAIQFVKDFFNSGAFIDWDAFLESDGVYIAEIEKE